MTILKSNEHWGRRSGSIRTLTIKGVEVVEKYFKQSQWGHGSSNSAPKKKGMRQQPIFGNKNYKEENE